MEEGNVLLYGVLTFRHIGPRFWYFDGNKYLATFFNPGGPAFSLGWMHAFHKQKFIQSQNQSQVRSKNRTPWVKIFRYLNHRKIP